VRAPALGPGALPVVELQIETVSEGRAKPKWLALELLKTLRHPVYEHIGSMDELKHYMPSKGRDEGSLRSALKSAFTGRYTRRVVLDEIHLLTHTKDRDLRASILESVKSSCAINRTLIGIGGYEVAYNGLFDSAHFVGRVIAHDFGNYSSSQPEDIKTWVGILKTYSSHLQLAHDTLLIDCFGDLIYWTNGVVGLLDKLLWTAANKARARHVRIDRNILLSCRPPEFERRAIEKDIDRGQKAIAAGESRKDPPKDESSAPVDPKPTATRERRAFERNPNRNAAKEVSFHDDD
jgi:hypothetical protein